MVLATGQLQRYSDYSSAADYSKDRLAPTCSALLPTIGAENPVFRQQLIVVHEEQLKRCNLRYLEYRVAGMGDDLRAHLDQPSTRSKP
jgi:hypothetical protein